MDEQQTPESSDALDDQSVEEGAGGFSDELSQRDIKLVQKAFEQRWPISAEMKKALLNKVARTMLLSPNPRVTFAGARIMLTAEKQNQADELKQLPDKSISAHIHVDAEEAAQQLSIEELRIMRKMRRRVIDGEVREPGANGNGHE